MPLNLEAIPPQVRRIEEWLAEVSHVVTLFLFSEP